MKFSPITASRVITEKYKRYLKTIFRIHDDSYSKQFIDSLENEMELAAGPFLDVTDSFEKGNSIKGLVESGILSERFSLLKFNYNRPLYKHQEKAILKAINDRNIVVSTGTGSGKTEGFLIPILNHLLKEEAQGDLGPGVRALLIYPMNALANDQIGRLRVILSEYPSITFGSYTGQTKHKYERAFAEYRSLNDDAVPKANELISREQMKAAPPNIMITNYAMLEYLMLRPEDSIFFDSNYSDKWKYIVLDEAHVYSGSTGIEVSMLLRRLKATLKNSSIRYILTSATLGGDEDNSDVIEFASSLCNSNFFNGDVIRASRTVLKPEENLKKLNINTYSSLAKRIREIGIENISIGDFSNEIVQIKNETSIETLFNLITNDKNFYIIKQFLDKPQTINSISKHMKWTKQELEDFVDVASVAEKEGVRPFDARYHMFLRATESVFVTLKPSHKLFLHRKNFHTEKDGQNYKVFEIGTCSYCHEIYLLGKIEGNYFNQSSNRYSDEENTILFLADDISDTDEEHLLADEKISAEEFELCPQCGFIKRAKALGANHCEHSEQSYIKVFKVNIKNETRKLTKCLACENTNNHGIIRTFFTGQEAVTSVIGTALFGALPSYRVKFENRVKNNNSGFGFQNTNRIEHRISEAKQFLAFSDSRQAAAFYASYLQQTYKNILYKRIIVETIQSFDGQVNMNVPRFVDYVQHQFEKYKVAGRDSDIVRKEAWKAVLHEISDNNGTTSLHNMGLIGLGLDPANIPANPNYNLTTDDVVSLCSVFALGMMAEASISYNEQLNRRDKEFFAHGGVEYSYTLSASDRKNYTRSFIPTRSNLRNKRLDYLDRVLRKEGVESDNENLAEILQAIWEGIFVNQAYKYAVPNQGKYKLNTDKIIISGGNQYYFCSKCKKLTIHNVKDVCPTYKCDGILQKIDLESALADNHYYRIYNDMDIRELRVVEHTAQLDREKAYEYQKLFQKKEVDVLSCSTTFEMGVDVGSLETVFMRNMPPSPANYSQRAGRAGRNKNSAAYALTFCNRSNHDFTFFDMPKKMIKGLINPPKFNVENDKIAIRHLYASALSFFWRENPEYFSKVSNMTENDSGGLTGFQDFEQYLLSKPSLIKEFAKSFLPSSLVDKFGVSDFLWVNRLICKDDTQPGVLTKAIAEYEYEVGILEEAIKRAYDAEKPVDYLRARIRVYKSESILSFLSRKNVLPKYGFPVDTVEMFVSGSASSGKLGLQLQRDLSIAISEYAPGSQIVANDNLITSRYIRKVPNMSWKMYDFIFCNACNTLNIQPHVDDENIAVLHSCKQCNLSFSIAEVKSFIIPSFGFEADSDRIKKPSLIKPERTYRSDVAYVGYNDDLEFRKCKIGEADIELSINLGDKMAVINTSKFYVCEKCGYTELDDKNFSRFKIINHKKSSGFNCSNNRLKQFSLGYRFETDVVQIRFINPYIRNWEEGLSILYGLLKGISTYLNIEDSDISGCLQYFINEYSRQGSYAIIIYDKTPGGAGHSKRLNDERTLKEVFNTTLELMKQCKCGGDTMDSSCYSCLRNYYNQKHHDILQRSYVIKFINELFN